MQGGNLTCIDGGGLTCAGRGVLIYLNQGEITLNGNGNVNLPAYKTGCSPLYTGTCWDGLTFWQRGTNEATLNGTDNFNIGSVYIPSANLKANGNGGGAEINITGVVVANTVSISGTFQFNIVVPTNVPDITPENDLGLEK
jgi:hypothetical protein